MLRMAIIWAVAAVPEGLWMAVTIILAMGMRRILNHEGLVKNYLLLKHWVLSQWSASIKQNTDWGAHAGHSYRFYRCQCFASDHRLLQQPGWAGWNSALAIRDQTFAWRSKNKCWINHPAGGRIVHQRNKIHDYVGYGRKSRPWRTLIPQRRTGNCLVYVRWREIRPDPFFDEWVSG